ncbi:MAG: hypothetical protein A3E07_03085 [Candidatus Wildermuthbacteria bacterium RIFCSPHIGHO2_12_FULL_45_9]|uniref:DUF4145 domain-containing protein n=1 Tax=Candidatus Wildermuthbacteria bacterium RIFCSPHIGHO2_02_FULL_45_25 TaxID=1802450 RepID=A0A1G2QZ37_9BACT|nr:MAG: hypothetical protein A2748_02655 [Candidatus Wildermuthbacteria bacterium RIFCSPHIGHO2_01_FULL_45_20]OHA65262.1 MAG: hypothetical protein A3C04_03080 [Candidatus Wildermuthbacteria bacterium RIFCSPHIGHO2_02_FULL_45_25]OHA71451.1 MAG: hypothetical protein A3E07_03085 [Candidatus Wildermuthbacteria bacterium RIFCSPHIGHO2_12_FULL_45_9]
METILQIIAVANSAELQSRLIWLRTPFVILTAFFVFMIGYVLATTSYLQFSLFVEIAEFFAFRPFGLRRLTKKWRRVMRRLETGAEADFKLSILEADTMLAGVLKRMVIPGTTIDEKLMQLSPVVIPNIEDLRNAHQVRNNIAHDPDFRISLLEARRALESYERAFRALDLI